MRHPSYAEGNSPVQQNITGAKKHKFGQEDTQKQQNNVILQKVGCMIFGQG